MKSSGQDLTNQEMVKKKAVKKKTDVNVHYGSVDREEKEDAVHKLLHHYSDWTKLKRAVVWWMKLKKKFLMRIRGTEPEKDDLQPNLTSDDLDKAEMVIIRHIQDESFPQEMNACQRKHEEKTGIDKPLKKSSKLGKLNPEYRDGLLRVGGRLRNAPIAEDEKHPVILPKNHHVSKLIIQHIHRKIGHQGRNHILAELRQKYWVIGAGAMTKIVVRKCIICQKNRAKAGEQMMADLPAYRVQGEQPPFTNVGMDFFGPFAVKCGRSSKKRYGVVFTCM